MAWHRLSPCSASRQTAERYRSRAHEKSRGYFQELGSPPSDCYRGSDPCVFDGFLEGIGIHERRNDPLLQESLTAWPFTRSGNPENVHASFLSDESLTVRNYR